MGLIKNYKPVTRKRNGVHKAKQSALFQQSGKWDELNPILEQAPIRGYDSEEWIAIDLDPNDVNKAAAAISTWKRKYNAERSQQEQIHIKASKGDKPGQLLIQKVMFTDMPKSHRSMINRRNTKWANAIATVNDLGIGSETVIKTNKPEHAREAIRDRCKGNDWELFITAIPKVGLYVQKIAKSQEQ